MRMALQEHAKIGLVSLGFILSFFKTITDSFFCPFHSQLKSYNSSEHRLFCTNWTVSTSIGELVGSHFYHNLLIQNFVAFLPCLILSAWSDRHGRRLLIAVPLVGFIAYDVIIIIYMFVPSAPSFLIPFARGIMGLCGTQVLVAIGCICHLTDRTDFRSRTWNLGLFWGFVSLGEGIALISRGFSQDMFYSFPRREIIVVFLATKIVIELLFTLYIKIFLAESVFILGYFQGSPWRNLVTPINVTEAVSSVFKKRSSNIRFFIILLLTAFLFYTTTCYGNQVIIPIYQKRSFEWEFSKTDLLLGSGQVLQSLFVYVVLRFAARFHYLDASLGAAGSLSMAISSLLMAINDSSFAVCIAVLFQTMALLVPIAIISMLSKLVEHSETGSIFAGVGFITLLAPVLALTSYHYLQDLTYEADAPELVFLISFGLSCLGLFLLVYLRKNIPADLLGHITHDEGMLLTSGRRVKGAIF